MHQNKIFKIARGMIMAHDGSRRPQLANERGQGIWSARLWQDYSQDPEQAVIWSAQQSRTEAGGEVKGHSR